ncbi:hypothetical protein JRJ22_02065 [Paenibacillus tianjinensis]|uniref:Uncharacterized protein n=1 Tax=Paenibacillus tianjinensis TaxID=2810347 RepID=A0ABX7LG63_9BACL|nr:hypothetical protein JRJ22_02065 [Paenibacillus tianjinensis]
MRKNRRQRRTSAAVRIQAETGLMPKRGGIKGLSLYTYEVSCRIRAVRVALPGENAGVAVSSGFTPWPYQPDGSPVSRWAGIQRSNIIIFANRFNTNHTLSGMAL